MAQLPTRCTSAIHRVISALRSARTTSWFTARAGPTPRISEVIGSAVRAHMDLARASPTIGTSALASDSATDYGSDAGHSPGGGRTAGDGATIITTITSALITSTSTTIGTTGLFLTNMVMALMRGTAESGHLTGADILIRIPVAASST